MSIRASTLVVLVCLAVVSSAHATPDPWPNYGSHTSLVSYVQVQPYNTLDALWDFQLTVLTGSYESEHGGVIGIKALAVYPNGGSAEPQLAGWTGYAAYVRPNWNDNGGWHVEQGAYGYLTNSPSYYITPGQSNQLIGSAQYPPTYVPPDQVFLVHVACNDGYTYWARPEIAATIVPEPGTTVLWIGAVLPLLGAVRRRLWRR